MSFTTHVASGNFFIALDGGFVLSQDCLLAIELIAP